MDGYQVNIAELGKLIRTLEDGAEQVREANKTLAAVGQLDMLGNDRLGGEAHEFEEKWEYGLDKLDEAAEGVIERLDNAKKNYEALEQEYSDLIGKFELPEAPPGIPGGGYTGGIGDVLGGGS